MTKTLIHTALLAEAQPLINFLKLKQNISLNLPNGNKIFFDDNENYILIVSGIGKENTIKSLNFDYSGPIDGHDLPKLISELERLKN